MYGRDILMKPETSIVQVQDLNNAPQHFQPHEGPHQGGLGHQGPPHLQTHGEALVDCRELKLQNLKAKTFTYNILKLHLSITLSLFFPLKVTFSLLTLYLNFPLLSDDGHPSFLIEIVLVRLGQRGKNIIQAEWAQLFGCSN